MFRLAFIHLVLLIFFMVLGAKSGTWHIEEHTVSESSPSLVLVNAGFYLFICQSLPGARILAGFHGEASTYYAILTWRKAVCRSKTTVSA